MKLYLCTKVIKDKNHNIRHYVLVPKDDPNAPLTVSKDTLKRKILNAQAVVVNLTLTKDGKLRLNNKTFADFANM